MVCGRDRSHSGYRSILAGDPAWCAHGLGASRMIAALLAAVAVAVVLLMLDV